MIESRIENEWMKIVHSDVCDYFHRLGRARQYPGYEPWHCFAIVAIIDQEITCDELASAGLLINPLLWNGCDGLYEKVKSKLKLCKEGDINQFLSDVSEQMEHRVKRYQHHDDYRDWLTFHWYLNHRDQGCIWKL